MRLITLHKILIASATLLALIFAGWELVLSPQRGTAPALVGAGLSATVAAAMAIYYARYLRRRR